MDRGTVLDDINHPALGDSLSFNYGWVSHAKILLSGNHISGEAIVVDSPR